MSRCKKFPVLKPEQFREMPGMGIQGTVNGAAIKIGSAEFVGYQEDTSNKRDGLLGQSVVFVSVNGQIRGYYAFKSHYRSGLYEVLSYLGQMTTRHLKPATTSLQKAAQRVWLLSGDRDAEAARFTALFSRRKRHVVQLLASRTSWILLETFRKATAM